MKRKPSGSLTLLITAGAVLALTTPVDYAWTAFLANHKLDAFAEFMGRSIFEGEMPGGGDPVIMFMVGVVGLYYATLKAEAGSRLSRMRPAVGFLVIASIVTAIFNVHSLKWIMGRARPGAVFSGEFPFTPWFAFGPLLMDQGIFHGSFPSGHTALAFAPFTLVYALAGRRGLAAIAVGAVVALDALAMGIARCMTASHWISDVAGSIVLSIAAMHLLYFYLLKVPEQEAALPQGTDSRKIMVGWELWMALCIGLSYAGVTAVACGLRILWHQGLLHWWSLLVPVGVGLIWAGIRNACRLAGRLHRSLTPLPLP